MARSLSKIADEICHDLVIRGALTLDDLRDRVDLCTGGDLDCQPLDILADLVFARLSPDHRQLISKNG